MEQATRSLHLTVDDPNPTYLRAREAAIIKFVEVHGRWFEPEGEYYLAGPMTGIRGFNFPAFDEAAAQLRAEGFLILSPAEMDDDSEREAALASDGMPNAHTSLHPRAHYLKRDFLIVTEVRDGIIVLPGWERSSGARGETAIAYGLDKRVRGVYPRLHNLRWEDHPYYVAGQYFLG